jgi:hypothetical protein
LACLYLPTSACVYASALPGGSSPVSFEFLQAPAELRRHIGELEAEHLRLRAAAQFPADILARHIARNEQQCSAGPAMAPNNGKWEIPDPILDEQLCRELGLFVGSC